MLIILGGLPGSGKTTLAKRIAKTVKATYIRIDSIEQAIKRSNLKIAEIADVGYVVGYALAQDNLSLGQVVIADSVNPIALTRMAWIDVAKKLKKDVVEVEVVCSDTSEHKNRIKMRKADIPGHVLPDWEKVETREYKNWDSKDITIDTSDKTVSESVDELLKKLQPFLPTVKAGFGGA